MAIPDPHAIPDSDAAAAAYLTEADQAWDGGDSDHAYDVYHSLWQSTFATEAVKSHVAYRLALILVNRGETDAAYDWTGYSTEPGVADLRRSLDNSTRGDPTPDPDVIPSTLEESDAWWDAGIKAKEAGDHDRAARFFGSIASSPVNQPDVVAKAEVQVGQALEQLGQPDTARLWYEKALPNLSEPDLAKRVRDMLGNVGVHSTADHTSPAAEQLVIGIEAYQLGDLAAARAALEATLHLDGPADVKGRARYYLGAMDYQDRRYADARNHLEEAARSAPDQERGWATEMLSWHWDEAVTP